MGNQDEYRYAQTVISGATGALFFPMGSTSVLGNTALGGAVGGTNTALTNWWYGENASVLDATQNGAFFGGLGTLAGRWATGYLQKTQPLFIGNTPYNPAVALLLQNVKPNLFPGQAGFAIEQGVSNIPSFLGSTEGDKKK